jgi:hypothetical protein
MRSVDYLYKFRTYRILAVETKGTGAAVRIEFSVPDRRILRSLRLSDELKDESETEAFDIMVAKYKSRIPFRTETGTIKLVIEKGEWKIDSGHVKQGIDTNH